MEFENLYDFIEMYQEELEKAATQEAIKLAGIGDARDPYFLVEQLGYKIIYNVMNDPTVNDACVDDDDILNAIDLINHLVLRKIEKIL